MKINQFQLKSLHMYLLVVLPIIIGWHFQYEGARYAVAKGKGNKNTIKVHFK